MGLNIAGFDAMGNRIATPDVATQQSQQNRFANIIGTAIQGTVAVIQQLKQPTTTYPAAITGPVPGGTLGAAAAQTPGSTLGVPTWTFWLLGGAIILLTGAAVLTRR